MKTLLNDLSQKLRSLPGKTDRERGEWLPLWVHLTDTAGVMECLAEYWVPEQVKRAVCRSFPMEDFTSLCVFLALIHDIGKMTPVMVTKMLYGKTYEIQSRLSDSGLKIPDKSAFGRDVNLSPHALAGEAILLKEGIPKTITVITGAHHGKPQSKRCNVRDQLELYPYNYYGAYDSEGPEGRIWESLWKEWIDFSLSETNYDSISELPDPGMAEEMLLTGLVIMADWLASNTTYFPLISVSESGDSINPADRIRTGWDSIHLPSPWDADRFCLGKEGFFDEFGFYPNSLQEQVVKAVEESDSPGLMIIEAPMGTGKTETALAAAEILATREGCGGIFFGLPTQATANGIFPRLEQWALKQSEETVHAIRLAHGMADLNEYYQSLFHGTSTVAREDYPEDGLITHEWFEGRKQALLSEFVIGTIDQLLLAALKQKHVMLRHLGLSGKVVILDEVHSYDAYMDQYLDMALSWLGQYGTPVIMLSATLPAARRKEMVEAYAGTKKLQGEENWQENRSYPLITWTDNNYVNQETIPSSERTQTVRIKKYESDADVATCLKTALKDGGCAGVIVNTVKCAQELEKELSEKLPDKDILLIHAGFVASDRSEKEKTVLERVGKDSSYKDHDNLIIIGTQVLEQSLDIDFDFMITYLCPMDLLLQRLGRLHRHERKRPKRLAEATCVVLGALGDLDEGSEKVYGGWLLERTRALLPDEIILPDMIPGLVQEVYTEPGPELLEDLNLKSSWEAYNSEIGSKKIRAGAYCLRKPEKTPEKSVKRYKKETIEGLLDTNADTSGVAEKMRDARAQAMVRDGDPSLEVLVMVFHHNGQVGFLPWQNDGAVVSSDRPPSEEESICIARQRMRLPRVLCYPSVLDHTIDELEEMNRTYLNEWQRAPLLRGELILLLDENLTAEIGGYQLTYSKNDGISFEKSGKENKNGG